MSKIRKILGSVIIGGKSYAIGKLENGKFAVGALYESQVIEATKQFECINSAFEHWYANVPTGEIAHSSFIKQNF